MADSPCTTSQRRPRLLRRTPHTTRSCTPLGSVRLMWWKTTSPTRPIPANRSTSASTGSACSPRAQIGYQAMPSIIASQMRGSVGCSCRRQRPTRIYCVCGVAATTCAIRSGTCAMSWVSSCAFNFPTICFFLPTRATCRYFLCGPCITMSVYHVHIVVVYMCICIHTRRCSRWLDFMHGGGRSPRNAEHVTNWAAEVRQNVRRIASHPCLALYNGNNEGVKAISSVMHGTPVKITGDAQAVAAMDYAALFDSTVRTVVGAEDASRHFHASCPSNGYAVDDLDLGMHIHRMGDPFGGSFGDTRHYDYTSYCLDSSKYPAGRFVSEYGWQSYPSLHTLDAVTLPQDRAWNSTWAAHVQHHPDGNSELAVQNAIFFDPPVASSPRHFDAFVAQTQAVQALCIKTQSEFYRAQRNTTGSRTMGCMYWQLNDIWQAPSWASIEYGGRWKALHYHIKRAYQAIMVFPALTGTTAIPSASLDSNAHHRDVWDPTGARVGIQLVSDLMHAVATVNVSWVLWAWKSDTIVARNSTVVASMPALSVVEVLPSTSLSELLPRGVAATQAVLVVAAGGADPEQQTQNELYLSPFKLIDFSGKRPLVSITVRVTAQADDGVTIELELHSSALVPLLFVDSPLDGRFSDNSFLMLPTEGQDAVAPKMLTFIPWTSSGEPPVDPQAFVQTLTATSVARDIEVQVKRA
eukprot:m.1098586 g.1098586  ORF g.1098586 m.1098586 type:complete len:693 (-) comp24314_c0_seq12:202-2280(-)